MAEKAGLLQPEATAALGASSSRESSPDEHSRLAQHSMDSLLLSGESSDDVILDDMEDEEVLVSGEDDEEEDEAIVETDAGVLNTMVEEGTETVSGGSSATGPKKVHVVSSSSEESTTRRKAKRRISRTRERKISISSSRLKVNKASLCMYCVCTGCIPRRQLPLCKARPFDNRQVIKHEVNALQ